MRTYWVKVTLDGANPSAGLPALGGGQIGEQAADEYELRRRLRGTFASAPKAEVEEIRRVEGGAEG